MFPANRNQGFNPPPPHPPNNNVDNESDQYRENPYEYLPSASAPSYSEVVSAEVVNPDVPYVDQSFSTSNANNVELLRRFEQERKDAELARRLQEGEVANPPSASTNPPMTSNENFNSHPHDNNNTMYNLGTHAMIMTEQEIRDQELARHIQQQEQASADQERRIQQELRDKELARQIQEQEQNSVRNESMIRGNNSTRRVAPITGMSIPQSMEDSGMNGPPRRRGCDRRRIINGGVMLTIFVIAVISVMMFGSNIWESLGGDPNVLPPFFSDNWNDNFDGDQTFAEWPNKGKGLSLLIQNSLSDDWDKYFNVAVDEWNEADSLSLSTKVSKNKDQYCNSHVEGIMVVCNDFYGKNGWTGLNELYLQGNNISGSVARMNESYLNGSGDAERQYVMCHEIGHGFGLPHRDENANNPDLGSCLDYTYRYKNNMQPDPIVDFDNLLNMYGPIGGRRNRDRHRTRNLIPFAREDEVDEFFSKISLTAKKSWTYSEGRLLHQSDHKMIYVNDLGNGAKVVTTLLLSRDEH